MCFIVLSFEQLKAFMCVSNNIVLGDLSCIRVSTELANTRIIDVAFSKAINYQRELFRVYPNLKCSQTEGCVTGAVTRQTIGSPPLAGTFKLSFNGQVSEPFSHNIRSRDLESSVNLMSLFGMSLCDTLSTQILPINFAMLITCAI